MDEFILEWQSEAPTEHFAFFKGSSIPVDGWGGIFRVWHSPKSATVSRQRAAIKTHQNTSSHLAGILPLVDLNNAVSVALVFQAWVFYQQKSPGPERREEVFCFVGSKKLQQI